MPTVATTLTRINRAPLVGAHFHPPAKLLLGVLRGGTRLHLHREPDNPYDPNAIGVWLWTDDIDYELPLDADAMSGYGYTTQDLVEAERWQLGHVAAKTGEAAVLAPLLDAAAEPPLCTLGFDMRGNPTVNIDWNR